MTREHAGIAQATPTTVSPGLSGDVVRSRTVTLRSPLRYPPAKIRDRDKDGAASEGPKATAKRSATPSLRAIVSSLSASLLLALAALVVSAPVASSQSTHRFADWTSVTGGVAGGTLSGSSVSLSGSDVNVPPASKVDGSSTVFNRPEFSPPLAASDAIHFIGSPGGTYLLQFGAPVTNPVLHLGSLASTLEFPAGTQITRLSGDSEFSVSGSTVSGGLDLPSDDANGSVRLSGTFSSIPFRATFQGSDGIYLQVGVVVPAPPPTVPPAPETIITHPAPQPAVIWTTQTTFRFTSSIPNSAFQCRVDGAAWAPCSSPYTTPSLAGGPHTFEARAISPHGVVDPTPAQRSFSVGQTTLRRLSCEVRPALWWILTGWREAPDQMACQVARRTSRGCPQRPSVHMETLCRWTTETCPRGARCTITTDAHWYDADQRIRWGAEAIASLGATNWGEGTANHLRVPTARRTCRTGPNGDRCHARASLAVLGDDRPVLVACVGAPEFFEGVGIPGGAHGPTPGVGPDYVRRIECDGELRIDPAAPLETVATGSLAQILAPGPGKLTLGSVVRKAGGASSAARSARPRLAPVRRSVAGEGPVTVKLKPNSAARRVIKRKKRLRVSLRVSFTAPGRRPLSRTTRVTLTPRAKGPRRCRAPRKPSSRPKRRSRPAPCRALRRG